MAGSLDGIRVLDLGRFIAIPFATSLLAHMGAEVIKIEKSADVLDRGAGLPGPSGDGYGFANINLNKKAISLNFEENKRARALLDELVKRSDVVMENFTPEAAEAIGLTYEKLKAVKPDIIFARVTGFGESGPYRDRIALDPIIKAMAGIIGISGFPDIPAREHANTIDYATALLTTSGVLAALFHREKTGEGQVIDANLLQTAVTFMAPILGEWEIGGKKRSRLGNRGHWVGPYDLFKTKDGRFVMLTIYPDRIWRRWCHSIGREDLFAPPNFHTDMARWEHRDEVDPVVIGWVAAHTAEEITAVCQKMRVPCGIVAEQTEVAHDPQVKAAAMLTEVPTPDGKNTLLVTNPPLKMSKTPLKIRRPFPAMAQHNEEVYCGLLGYSRDDLKELREHGVI